ncbi:hypothetical protein RJI07_02930 [Mycoplasmatota bacterium WC30]
MSKSITAKQLLKFYKTKKYSSLKNADKYNKLEDLDEFYINVKLDYNLLREVPDKFLISVIEDYVLIQTKDEEIGDTFNFDSLDDLYKMVYLLDDLFFTMRIGGMDLFYNTKFCYFIEDTEKYLDMVGENKFLDLFKNINQISGASKLSKSKIIERLRNDKAAKDIKKLSINKQDEIYELERELLKLSFKSRKNLFKYVKRQLMKNAGR